MKKTLLLLLLFVSCVIYAQIKPTTQEEYNYITKGYKIQIESGLDMKKGYDFKLLGKWNLTTGVEVRECEFKGLYRTNEAKPCAIMLIYHRTDIANPTTYYICVPTGQNIEFIWKQTEDFIKSYLSENIQMMQALIYCLMHFSSNESTY